MVELNWEALWEGLAILVAVAAILFFADEL
jgi:hypothetical protein